MRHLGPFGCIKTVIFTENANLSKTGFKEKNHTIGSTDHQVQHLNGFAIFHKAQHTHSLWKMAKKPNPFRFPNTFRIEFSEKEFVCNKGHYSLDNIEQKRRKDNLLKKKLSFKRNLSKKFRTLSNTPTFRAKKNNCQFFCIVLVKFKYGQSLSIKCLSECTFIKQVIWTFYNFQRNINLLGESIQGHWVMSGPTSTTWHTPSPRPNHIYHPASYTTSIKIKCQIF